MQKAKRKYKSSITWRVIPMVSMFLILPNPLTLISHASDQPLDVEHLSRILKETESYSPGAILLASSPSGTFFKSVGYSNRKTKTPMNKESVLRIASITKTYVATLAMMAVQEGLLDLNNTIDMYLDASILNKLPKNLNPTVRQLLNHTSGIPDYYDLRFYLKDWRKTEVL